MSRAIGDKLIAALNDLKKRSFPIASTGKLPPLTSPNKRTNVLPIIMSNKTNKVPKKDSIISFTK
jgi:hypothetical protein